MTGREYEALLLARLAPKKHEAILDIGCGTGEDVERIVRAGSGIHVVGMDRSEPMVQRARRRLARWIKIGRTQLVTADASKALPFPSGQFDAVLSSELMECILPARRSRLLREIHRVLKPRGRVVVAHTDWDTQVWNTTDRALERRLVHAFCDWTQGWMEHSDGWMGRKILGLFRRSNLFKHVVLDVHVLTNDRYKPGTYGYARAQDFKSLPRASTGVKATEVKRFLGDLRARNRAKEYCYSVNRYVVTATRV